jgi:adenylosuccinate synthase
MRVVTQAHGVIGACYGDEGKGRTVDAIVHRLGAGTVVVRSNGGAQAGHTVVAPSGARHVFHQLGSGAFAGAATHFSCFMVSHPMMLAEEVAAVAALGGETAITADPRGYVTTPWDMMVNQAIEMARGGGRHGSCGLGFGETVLRCEESGFGLSVADLRAGGLRDRLVAIRDVWLPARLAALGVGDAGAEFLAFAASDAVFDRYLADCRLFAELVALSDDADLGKARHVVFEAAQGLMLDQRHRDFPHLTRSNTGIRNMLAIAAEAGIASLDAYYATRCYITRHGRGPMADERDIAGFFTVDDPTNVPNPWQEAIRTGLLDVDTLAETIAADAALAAETGIALTRRLAVSCLDQAVAGVVTCLAGGEMVRVSSLAFPFWLGTTVGAVNATGWWSPARENLALCA